MKTCITSVLGRIVYASIVGVALVCLTFNPATAADYFWTGGGDGTNWTDAANWSPATGWPDGAIDRVSFTNGHASVILPADLTLGALTLGTHYFGTNSLTGNLNLINTGGHAGSLTVEGGLFVTGKDVVSGIAADGHVFIGTNGTLVVRRSSTVGEGLGQTITAGAMTVDGLLSADYEGFDDDNGGPSPGSGYLSPGGCHGGITGIGSRTTYGSATNPVSLGSRGNEGAFGGGAISLAVSGVLAVDGLVSASGKGISSGSGAGGSINLKAAQLVGTGMVRARGGDSANRHGGGGGRISLVEIGTNDFAGSIQVHGGLSLSFDYPHGSAGTIAFPDDYDLTLGGAGGMSQLRLGQDDQGNAYVFNTIVIEAGGLLELDGNRKLNDGLGGPTVITARIIDVKQGGQISADGLGFKAGSGFSGNTGGTYGGRGGCNNLKPTYGCFTNPVVFGSGGGAFEREGGGVVRLQATAFLQVDGVVSVDGSDAGYYGGSGGSVNLIAPELRGSGVIRANGGSSAWRGGGGGGRISLVQVDDIAFTGTIEALPGGFNASYNPRPFSGTIAFPAGYDLTLGGPGNMQSLRLGSDDNHAYDFGAIVINDGGLLEIDGNPMREGFFGGAAALRAVSLDVQLGGTLSAFGLGLGELRAAPDNYAHNEGGPHGGSGGGNSLTYGSVTNPINLGSGSYAGGGGGLILQVETTCNLDGMITASAPHSSSFGGGAGGTVNISASVLSGSGEIAADAGDGTRHGGGGGRIALKAPVSSFSGTLSALGGSGHASYGGHGAGGTIFTDLNGVRRVLVDNDKVHEDKPTYTWLPAVTNAVAASELDAVTLEVTNFGRVALTNDVTVGDLYLGGEIVSLFLNGWTLTVDSRYHDDWGNVSLVHYDDGEIVWRVSGTILVIR